MVCTKLVPKTTRRRINSKVNIVISLLLVSIWSFLFDVFSGGDDRRTAFINGAFAKSDGGGVSAVFWISGSGFGGNGSQSNVGIAVAVTVMAGLAVAATLVYSNRGHLQSPWSRRRRKHALQPEQWKSLFDEDGRLVDGGVKFLKKVRSGGVHPSIRAEVWPFLLGVYDLKSSKEERDAVKAKNRKEYEKLRKHCRLTYKLNDKTTQSINETSGCNNKDDESDASESSDSDASVESEVMHPEKLPTDTGSKTLLPYRSESFATWQRIIRLDAIRTNAEWILHSPSQSSVTSPEAINLAEHVHLKDYTHLEPCRIFHAARIVSILEAYALYDSEIGYCQVGVCRARFGY